MFTRKEILHAGAAALAALAGGGCRMPPKRRSLEWTAMGTVARVTARAAADAAAERAAAAALAAVKPLFAEIEQALSAFNPDSDLSRLAPLPDDQVLEKCPPFARPCFEAAFTLRDETHGKFSPRWKGPGTLDLGAIAKGFAVDLAAGRLCNLEADVLVDLGGNLKAASGAWTVGVRDPRSRGAIGSFTLAPGEACATSGEYERGRHIRDGRTGKAVAATVGGVTVIHPSSAMLADGLSTTMFILGRKDGEAFLDRFYPEARAIWC